MIKLIIFDWDDVFTLGSREGYFKCYHAVLEELGVHLEPEEEKARILAKWGQPYREELRELLKEKPELLDQACKLYEKHYFGETFISCLTLVTGVRKLLERLSQKYTLAIATGSHPDMLIKRIFPKFAVPNVFSQILSAHDVTDPTKTKPHPHMTELILEKQAVKPAEAIFVGDAKNDVLMAQAAGVRPVVVLTGNLTKTEAEELGVADIIDDVTELEKVV